MNLWLVVLSSFFVSILTYWYGYKFFLKREVLDNPKKYNFKRNPVPYSMGVWAIIAFLILVLLFLNVNWQVLAILLALIILGIVCFVDDLFGISAKYRLIIQFICAFIVVVAGTNITFVTNPFNLNSVIELGWFGILFSMFWIVAITNLMNFLDGVSGLSSGVSSIGFFVLLMLSVVPGAHLIDQSMLQVMAASLFVISFLAFIFEFPTPKFLVGDSGTMFFGFMLGVLSMINGGKLATASLVLLIPLFDGLWVILRRLYKKNSPFKGDLNHLHHRLERIGLSKESILVLYVFVSLIFGLIAVFVWNTFFKVISLLLLVASLSIFGYLVWIKEKK